MVTKMILNLALYTAKPLLPSMKVAQVLGFNKTVLALKHPGESDWSGRGNPQTYRRAYVCVYRIISITRRPVFDSWTSYAGDATLEVEELLQWHTRNADRTARAGLRLLETASSGAHDLGVTK